MKGGHPPAGEEWLAERRGGRRWCLQFLIWELMVEGWGSRLSGADDITQIGLARLRYDLNAEAHTGKYCGEIFRSAVFYLCIFAFFQVS